jgi:SAM-dependent methyltransferase
MPIEPGHTKTAKEVFEAWGRDYHADGMETEHWSRVRQMFDLIEPCAGSYLEIGIGNGYGLAHMAKHQFAGGSCVGLDLSGSMVRRARDRTSGLANVVVEAGDFLSWDPGCRRFDLVFSMEVFYYFDDVDAGIGKAWSLLEPGGSLWVAVNFYEENEQSADWPEVLGTPMRRLSMRDWVGSFERAGFEAVEQRLIAGPTAKDGPHGDGPTLLTIGTRPE